MIDGRVPALWRIISNPMSIWLLLLASAGQDVDFDREVRPILAERCLTCHGGIRRKGGLSLMTAAEAQAPAKSRRKAVVPGRPGESELLERVAHADPDRRMPQEGPPLGEAEIGTLRRWISGGAAWPSTWSFRAIRRPEPLPAAPAARHEIDRFILARLAKAGIAPAPDADRPTLIRRLSLDLLGLPPSPAEVDAFASDPAPDAAERLVDRLLASPRFGERWGRHWLDLARYADSDGYEVDNPRPHAWHWRDWVIRAVNDDMPFDRFTLEQLAGDLLPDAGPDQRLATAFHRQTLTNKEAGIDKEEYRVKAVFDRVNTTATVWLGLTLGCATCHHHPHDPVSQREYYRLFAFFNNADEADLPRAAAAEEVAQLLRAREERERRLAELREELSQAAPAEQEGVRKRIQELEKEGADPATVRMAVLAERAEPRTTHLFRIGNFQDPVKDESLAPGTPGVLHPFRPRDPARPDRLDLARWLVDPANPLTARVAVNHVWQHLFGHGLVRTPEDFGARGRPADHPELLDWLASEFVRLGWSRKALIRLIVGSAAYRRASRFDPEAQAVDPENRLLHRQNRFRVEAEVVRDLPLAVSGLLTDRVGGPSIYPPLPDGLTKIAFRSNLKWPVSEGPDRYRRGMYTFFKRSLPHPNLTVFDCPDGSVTAVSRSVSNTPLQALAMLNNEVFVEAARALARRVLREAAGDDARIVLAFRLLVSRTPTEGERARVAKLLEASRALAGPDDREVAAWTSVANVLFNLDEFMVRE